MTDIKDQWRDLIRKSLLQTGGDENISEEDVIAETPPRPEMGDLAFPMYPFARHLRKSPKDIAEAVEKDLNTRGVPGEVKAEGPYVNIRINRADYFTSVLEEVERQGDDFGRSYILDGQRILLEFSNPNTNKPLHIGHLRNNALGACVSRVLGAAGAEVLKVNLINDRGIHICKSMLAYREYGEGRTPEQENVKSDHFVGTYYVRYSQLERDDPEAENRARELLRAWEKGDRETVDLWKKMNKWVVDGIQETYRRTGITFDRVDFEHDTYLLGREEILKGLKKGLFYAKEDGSVWADLTDADLDHKVLLRKDGTSLYVTQDVGTAIQRSREWPFDRLIYVVASEQRYHFEVLFNVMKILGHEWSKNLFHLAYGMVNLPDGKIKSREGTQADGDNLLDELQALAEEEIRTKERETEIEDIEGTADKIALGALNYYLLATTAVKDITFDPRKSISFTGNTGPYLQYTGARISSVLRKYQNRLDEYTGGSVKADLLSVEEEWELIKGLASFQDSIIRTAEELNPSHLAGYLYDLTKVFNKYYHDNPILHNDADLVQTRIRLVRAVRQVLKNGLYLLGIPFLEKM